MDIANVKAILSEFSIEPSLQESILKRMEAVEAELSLETDTVIVAAFDPDQKTKTHDVVDDPSVDHRPMLPQIGARYQDMQLLGRGGMGEVRLVKDTVLNRRLAMKVLDARWIQKTQNYTRFVDEAQICAQLQHPNIVPIHDLGTLPDGRVYFTMKEVKGAHFRSVIDAVHQASQDGVWQSTVTGWTLFKLLDAFRQVCQAMGFAHDKGVIHRDLKPENIMIGDFGEVLVVDWGIAKVLGQGVLSYAEDEVSSVRHAHAFLQTRVGQIVGTPMYMAPEQVSGRSYTHDNRTDVYALGIVLYYLLKGTYPYEGRDVDNILKQIAVHHCIPIQTDAALPIPKELSDICDKAMAFDPDDRYASAHELALAIEGWLDGSKKHEKALQILTDAEELNVKRQRLSQEITALESAAEKGLETVSEGAPELEKEPWWQMEIAAAQKSRALRLITNERIQQLNTALNYKSDLDEAHQALIEHHRQAHVAAERIQDEIAMDFHAHKLRHHSLSLPPQNPVRQRELHYLKGTGALSIQTDVDGVDVLLEQYVPQLKRLVAKPVANLGCAPIVKRDLEQGSYRLRLRKSGHHEVLYPVFIGRGEHWDGLDAAHQPRPIHIPKASEVAADECYVPAGWFVCGGDPNALQGFERRLMWVDDFVMSRFPVTHRSYLSYLNGLLNAGQTELALQQVPRNRTGTAEGSGPMLYNRPHDGLFSVVTEIDGHAFSLDMPLCGIDYPMAMTYAEWLSRQTGHNWRIPTEFQWEKSARGVDARSFPWGPFMDPSYACVFLSNANTPNAASVYDYPIDESVYGVRGLAGNMMEWTSSPYQRTWKDAKEEQYRVLRGGGWFFSVGRARTAYRNYDTPDCKSVFLGMRLIRSLSSRP